MRMLTTTGVGSEAVRLPASAEAELSQAAAQKGTPATARRSAASDCARAHAGPIEEESVEIAAKHALEAPDAGGRAAGSRTS